MEPFLSSLFADMVEIDGDFEIVIFIETDDTPGDILYQCLHEGRCRTFDVISSSIQLHIFTQHIKLIS